MKQRLDGKREELEPKPPGQQIGFLASEQLAKTKGKKKKGKGK